MGGRRRRRRLGLGFRTGKKSKERGETCEKKQEEEEENNVTNIKTNRKFESMI